jgi:SAM-dependent methyltransferase
VTATALALYGAALRRAARGEEAALSLVDRVGTPVRRLDARTWYTELRPGDAGLINRCGYRTIDLGCGPGRLAAALVATGRQALGVDVSPQAVRYTRRRGAPALLGDVFGPLPDEGRWTCALLADGNIGIGGRPEHLLRRCRKLLGPHGTVLVEVDPPGTPDWRGDVVLSDGARTSSAFAWAFVSADRIATVAAGAGLRATGTWTEEGRWFAQLA